MAKLLKLLAILLLLSGCSEESTIDPGKAGKRVGTSPDASFGKLPPIYAERDELFLKITREGDLADEIVTRYKSPKVKGYGSEGYLRVILEETEDDLNLRVNIELKESSRFDKLKGVVHNAGNIKLFQYLPREPGEGTTVVLHGILYDLLLNDINVIIVPYIGEEPQDETILVLERRR